MNRKLGLTVLMLSFIIVFSGCGLFQRTEHREPAPTPEDPMKVRIGKMSLDEKIGQMVIVGLDGYEMDVHAEDLIQNRHVGGFILFKQNIKDAGQTLDLINSLKATNMNAANPLPLFISVDEEGGRVTRLPDEFTKLPTNQAIGRVNDPDFSFEIGSVIGKQLSSLGFNLDFAPVLDINSNPQNPVIGDRSFGNNAKLVSSLGISTMKGISSENVIPVVKHFPGHGDTSVDSHIGLPVVHKDLTSLRKFELIPFADAIQNQADVVMIAHILMSTLDAQNPASFSEKIITGVLRNELKYNGVVITDDMTMGAIVKNYSIEEAAVKSVAAGSDIVLVCHEYEKETAVIEALKEAVQRGTLSEKRIDQSVYRIIKLKQKYHLSDENTDAVDVNGINADVQSVLNSYMK